MKILFLCGSLQLGFDGVGDYTRRLCGELIKIGHQTQILSLSDNHSTIFSIEIQEVDGAEVGVHRIPKETSNHQRLVWTQGILNKFQPDWISLQYVPYSYHPKGLPFWLPSFIKKLKGNQQWHIMFHELWIGMDSNATFKSKCIGVLQKSIISKILKTKEKIIVHTQTQLYQFKLSALGYAAQLLPLFSNISNNSESGIEKGSLELELKFCIFGSIHFGAPVEQFIEDLKGLLSASNEPRALKFVFIGNCGVALDEWIRVLIAHDISYDITGFVDDTAISFLLSDCQYGIATTPYILSQKSGSVAAMFDHQLPVLCVARDWTVDGFHQEPFLNLVSYENKASLDEFIGSTFIHSNENDLEFVAVKFLKGLK